MNTTRRHCSYFYPLFGELGEGDRAIRENPGMVDFGMGVPRRGVATVDHGLPERHPGV